MHRHSETAAENNYPTVAATLVPPEVLNAPFTAQEISDAIAAVEKERREEAAREAETAQIAHVLDQLGLDLPAPSIAERVRQNRAASEKETLETKSVRAARFGVLTGLALGLIFVGFVVTTVVQSSADAPVPSRPLSKSPPVDPGTLLFTRHANGGTPVIQTFAEVADGVPVAITADKLRVLLAENLPPEMRDGVGASFDPACEWTVSRRNGEYYLFGYVEARMTPAALSPPPRFGCIIPAMSV